MFCDGCGKEVQAGQRFCNSCGKPVAVVAPVPTSKVVRHSHILGILWLVLSAFTLIGACILFILSMTIFGPWSHMQPPPDVPGGVGFLHVLFAFLGTLVLIKAVLDFAVGIGLLQRHPWARTLALVMSFFALLNVPFGTLLGIYTLAILMSPGAAEEYRLLSESAP
jgi:hypothetical protein